MIAEDAAGSSALTYAAANGHAAFVDMLADAGLTKGRDMALAFAVRGCSMPTVRRLLEAGAKTTAEVQGAPAIGLAAAVNCVDAIELLLARGANINAADGEGMTALMYAARMGFSGLVQLLLDRGADLDRMNTRNQTAWGIAAMANQREVVEILRVYREKHATVPSAR